MSPDMAMEVIPGIWEKCKHLRKLRFDELPMDHVETNEPFGNFYRLIYLLQVRMVCRPNFKNYYFLVRWGTSVWGGGNVCSPFLRTNPL